jgi:hypothetical protein
MSERFVESVQRRDAAPGDPLAHPLQGTRPWPGLDGLVHETGAQVLDQLLDETVAHGALHPGAILGKALAQARGERVEGGRILSHRLAESAPDALQAYFALARGAEAAAHARKLAPRPPPGPSLELLLPHVEQCRQPACADARVVHRLFVRVLVDAVRGRAQHVDSSLEGRLGAGSLVRGRW